MVSRFASVGAVRSGFRVRRGRRLFFPAASTFLPSLIKREQMIMANSVFQTTGNSTTIAAPAPAGILIKALGSAWAFFIDAASFLFIVGALWRLPDPPKAQACRGRPPVWRSILDGLAYVRRDVPLRTLMLVAAMMNLCLAGPLGVGLPYLTKIKFGSPTAYGLVVSAAAAGGLLRRFAGGHYQSTASRRSSAERLHGDQRLPCLDWPGGTSLADCRAAAGDGRKRRCGQCAHLASWIQQRVDATVRGRVMSVLMLSAFGLLPVSLAAAEY